MNTADNEFRTSLDVFPSYKGGRTCLYGGYVHEFAPEHPLCNRWGWVAQHRLVGEGIAGRPLLQHKDPSIRECVHHRDECRTNNDPSNLQVMTFSEHRSHHTRKRNEEFYAPKRPTAEQVAAALQGRSIKDAATLLGAHHQSLRNWYPELVAPRKRRSPTKLSNPHPDKLRILRAAAADPKIGLREAARLAGVSQKTVQNLCALHGWEWITKSKKGEVKRFYRGVPRD